MYRSLVVLLAVALFATVLSTPAMAQKVVSVESRETSLTPAVLRSQQTQSLVYKLDLAVAAEITITRVSREVVLTDSPSNISPFIAGQMYFAQADGTDWLVMSQSPRVQEQTETSQFNFLIRGSSATFHVSAAILQPNTGWVKIVVPADVSVQVYGLGILTPGQLPASSQ